MNKPFHRLVGTKLPREPPRIRDGQTGREGGDEIKEVRNEIKQRRVGIAAQTTRREPQTTQLSSPRKSCNEKKVNRTKQCAQRGRVNHATANALNSRLFAALCDDMGADYEQLLLHADVRWLSSGNSCQEYLSFETSLPSFFRTKTKLVTIVPRCGLDSQAGLFG
jgi:hypothetical protein